MEKLKTFTDDYKIRKISEILSGCAHATTHPIGNFSFDEISAMESNAGSNELIRTATQVLLVLWFDDESCIKLEISRKSDDAISKF